MKLTLPHDYALERTCLSAILRDSEAADEAALSLQADDFADGGHMRLFSHASTVHAQGQAVSHLSVARLIDKPQGNESWEYVLALSDSYFSGLDYAWYFDKLKNLSNLRRLMLMLDGTIKHCAEDGTNYESLIGDFYQRMIKLEAKSGSLKQPKEIFDNFKDGKSFVQFAEWRHDRYLKGLPTFQGVASGFPMLDATLGSFQDGCLYYIGARTSMGKTTFLLNLVSNMIDKYKVGIFSLEMDAPMIMEKLLCIKADLKYSRFSSGNFTAEQFERVKSLEPFFSSAKLWFDDEQGLTISNLYSRAHRLVKVYGCNILFIDYLTLVRSVGKHPNKHMQVDEVSKGLQTLAKQLKVPLVVLAQLNRGSTEDKRPGLTSFRESGSIEEDADACLLLHRPEYYDPTDKPGLIECIVAKNRVMGILKTIDFACDSQTSERYSELPPLRAETNTQTKEAFDDILGIKY